MNLPALLLLLAGTLGATAQRLPDGFDHKRAAREGLELTTELLSQVPAENLTNTGRLLVGRGKSAVEIPIRFTVQRMNGRWISVYEALTPDAGDSLTVLTVLHQPGQASCYFRGRPENPDHATPLNAEEVATLRFSKSDFWVGDLGLEFLRWPVQRLLKKELKRGQSCNVLESLNPDPPAGGYARVVSWLDIDTGGVVLAKAYDANRKRMKEFVPKRFKKVDGEWHLLEMRIEDVMSGSQTTILFDVGS